jgi:mRNA interferase RelE/StbE
MEVLDPPIGRRVLAKIESLAHGPRPAGCLKLQGAANLWRVRVGDWRVIYSIFDTEARVDIVGIRHRSDAYR